MRSELHKGELSAGPLPALAIALAALCTLSFLLALLSDTRRSLSYPLSFSHSFIYSRYTP